MPEIHVSYQPRLGDVVHGARITHRQLFRTWDRVVALVLAGLSASAAYRGSPIAAVVLGALAVEEWFDLLPASALVAYIRFKMDPTYRQPFELTLSPEGLQFRTRGITSQIEWSFFTRFWETKRAFVLFHGRVMPTVIPKAAFQGGAELDATRALLSAAIPAEAA